MVGVIEDEAERKNATNAFTVFGATKSAAVQVAEMESVLFIFAAPDTLKVEPIWTAPLMAAAPEMDILPVTASELIVISESRGMELLLLEIIERPNDDKLEVSEPESDSIWIVVTAVNETLMTVA